MSDIKILILGGGAMQLPAINSAHQMGWTTIVADGVSTVPGRAVADYFEKIDLKNTEAMIEAALRYKNSIGLDGVFTAGTDFSETVARVAHAAGLPGISIDASINASNKSNMRQVFRDHNISSPLFLSISKNTHFDNSILDNTGLDFPLVVKPVDNMGSRGIRRTDNYKHLKDAVAEAFEYSKSGNVIIEEYLEGSEYSIDALIYNNKIIICGFADRNIFYPPYFIEMGHTIPSVVNPEIARQIIDTFITAVRALGITEGAAKGDIRLSRGKVYIGEIAARLSGGYMSGWTFPYSSGVSLTKEALKIAVGLSPENLIPQFTKTSAERAFISIPGIIKEINGIDDACTDPCIKDIFLRIQTGDKVKFPENNVEKAGNCIAVNEIRSTAINSAEDACRKIFLRLEACNKETERFLFGELQSWVGDAFIIKDKKVIELLNTMPDFLFYSKNKIGLISFPISKLESLWEWHGKSLTTAFKEVLGKKYSFLNGNGIELILPGEIQSLVSDEVEKLTGGIMLGKFFYKALFRGGVQGGVWIIDTILNVMEENNNLLELLRRWKEY
jgi:biotin carboxylase